MHIPLWLIIVGFVLALLGVTLAIDQLGLWLEYKRWLYWRKFKPAESMRSTMSVFHEIVQPEVRYVEEDKRQRHAETDEQSPTSK